MSTTPELITQVHIEGSVILKIIKHCRENTPNTVYGKNWGHQKGSVLQLTNCFPVTDIESSNNNILTLLQSSHYDATEYGLYCSHIFGEYLDFEMAAVMVTHQTLSPNSVMVLYNPIMTQSGTVSIRVVRVSQKFLALEKAGAFTAENFKAMEATAADIFEEISFFIHNAHIVHAYLYELDQAKLLSPHDALLNPAPSSHAIDLIAQLSAGTGSNHQAPSFFEQYTSALERYQREVGYIARQQAEYVRKCEEIRVENQRRERNNLRKIAIPEAPRVQEPSFAELLLLASRIGSMSNDLLTLTSLSQQKQSTLKRMLTVNDKSAQTL